MTSTLSQHPDFARATRRISQATTSTATRRRERRRAWWSAFVLAADVALAVGIGAFLAVGACWLFWLVCRP